MSIIADTYLAATVRAAIESRLDDRRWYRRMVAAEPLRYGTYWSDLDRDNTTRLRELVRVTRQARDVARPAVERAEAQSKAMDAVDFYAGVAS